MGWLDFLSSSNKSRIYRVPKENYLIVSDVVPHDRVHLRKRKENNLINFSNKEIGASWTFMGKIVNNKLAKRLIDNNHKGYVATVHKAFGNIIEVKVEFYEINEEIDGKVGRNESEQSLERHLRIERKEEKKRKLAEEKRALLQGEYDKVLKTHQTKLNNFREQFGILENDFNKSKVEKLKMIIEKDIQKIERKSEKRSDVFCDRSDKWQESEKGELYDDITNELENIQCDMEIIIEKDIPKLIKNQNKMDE